MKTKEQKKQKQNTDTKKRRNIGSYCLSILGMALLLAAALYLPRFVFETQDSYRMTGTRVEKRDSLDIFYVNSEYVKSMHDRMEYFAGMEKETITASAIHYDDRDEETRKKDLNEVLNQEWIFRLMETTFYFYGEFYREPQAPDIRECKKYVVYGKDAQGQNKDQIALMLWYYELGWEGDSARMQLLVDSETDSIYYVRLTTGERPPEEENRQKTDGEKRDGGEKKYDYVISGDGDAEAATCGNVATDVSTADNTDVLHEFQAQLGYHLFFYNEYYEVDSDYGDVDSDYRDMDLLEKGLEPGIWIKRNENDNDRCRTVLGLPYGELSLQFVFQADYTAGARPDISMGVVEIGNLIPEMMQN